MSWIEKVEAGNLKAAVGEYVRLFDWVSFPELQRAFERYTAVYGQEAIIIQGRNIALWVEMAPALAEAILELAAEGALHYEGCELLVYLVDGGMLDLPLVKRPPKDGYKSLRWLPVCLRPGPMNGA